MSTLLQNLDLQGIITVLLAAWMAWKEYRDSKNKPKPVPQATLIATSVEEEADLPLSLDFVPDDSTDMALRSACLSLAAGKEETADKFWELAKELKNNANAK